MVSANSYTRRRCLVFIALMLGLWLGAGFQSRFSSAQSRPAAATAQTPTTASPEQARLSEQIAQQQAKFERAKRSVAGEVELTARYRSALQQACALPRHTLSWQSLGPGQVSKNDLCEALAATETKPFNPLEASGWTIEAGAVTPDAQQWWAGAGINGLWRGSTAGWQNVLSGFVGLTVSTTQDATNQSLYVARQGWELLKSADTGQSFSLISLSPAQQQTDDSLPVAPFAIAPQSEDLWTGGRHLWRSTNGGAQWQRASRALPSDASARFSAIAVALTKPDLVVAGTDQGELFRLDFARQADEQTSWPGVQPRAGFITSLTFDPQDSNTVYATYGTFGGAHIWKSTNGGATWLALDNLDASAAALPDVPVSALVVDPNDGQRLYVGTDLGVFATFDGAAHWHLLAADFGAASVRNLTIRQTTAGRQLFVFTAAQGLWTVPLPAVAGLAVPQQQCTVSLPSAGSLFESGGGNGSIAISAAPTCQWTVESTFPWVQITAGALGTGDGRVSFTVAANPSQTGRNAFLKVNERYFWLTQQGMGEACTPLPLNSGSVTSGELAPGDCWSAAYPGFVHYADRYSFAGRKGEFVVIGVTKSAQQPGLLGTLRLVTPTGEVIQPGGFEPTEVRLPGYFGGLRELPATGNYFFEVTSGQPQQTFSYQVTLQLTSMGCNRYNVLPLDRYFDPARTTGRVAISTLPGCRWDALSTVPWLTFNSNNQGSGNALLEFTIASNANGGVRSGNVEIAGQRFTVTQAGGNGNCVPLPLAIGQTVNGAFTTNDCPIRLGEQSTHNFRPADRYQFSGRARQRIQLVLSGVSRPLSAPFIVVTNARGDLLASGQGRLPAAVNGFFELPNDGSYLVEVSASPEINPIPYALSLFERNEGCSYALTPLQRFFEADGGTGEFQLSTGISCPWTLLPTPDWITVSETTGHSSTTLRLNIAPNLESTVRRAEINLGGQTALLTQAGVQGKCNPEPIASGRMISGQFTASDCPPQLYPGGIPLSPPGCNCSSTLPVADRYTFEVGADAQFSLLLNATSTAYPGIATGYALADAQGGVLQYGTVTAGQTTQPIALPGAGSYVIELLPFTPANYSYSFLVSLTPRGCNAAGQVTSSRFEATGGTGTLIITAGNGCPWRTTAVVEGTPWLSVNGSTDGNGNATRSFTVARNTTANARSGTLRLGTQSIVIEQAGASGTCLPVEIIPGQVVSGSLTAGDCTALYQDVTKPTVTAFADRYTFLATAGEQVILTGISPIFTGAGQQLTLVLTLIDPLGQVLSSSHTNRLPDGAYLLTMTGKYTVEVAASLNQVTNTTQAGPYQFLVELTTPGCVYFVDAGLLRFPNTATTHTLPVTTGGSCSWTPRATAEWLTASPTTGSTTNGNGTLTINLARNETNQARRASVLVGGQSIEVEQAGSGGDCRILPLTPNTPVTGSLSAGDCRFRPYPSNVSDRYSFTAQAGDQVLFRVAFTANTTTYTYPPALFLFDALGNSLTGLNTQPITAGAYLRLATAGMYFLEVVGAPSTFPYTLEMRRLAGTCELTVAETYQSFTGAADTGTITVRAANGCQWTARANVPWLTITSGAHGSGNGTISFAVAESITSGIRDGAIYVEDRSVSIRQQFIPPLPAACNPRPVAFGQTISAALTASDCVSPTSYGRRNVYADIYTFEANAGQKIAFETSLRQIDCQLTVYEANSNGYSLRQGSNRVPMGLNEFITLPRAGRYFCEVSSLSASTTGNYTIKLATPTGCNAMLAFANPATGGPFDNQLFEVTGGTGTVNVTTGAECPWTVQSNAEWLRTTGNGTGTGSFTFTVQPNLTDIYRTAQLTINQGGGTVGLIVEQIGAGGDCSARMLTPGERVTGSLKAGDCRTGITWQTPGPGAIVDRFLFTAQAGDQLIVVQEVRPLAAGGYAAIGAFTLYDPSGQIFGQSGQSHIPGTTYNALTLPANPLPLPKTGVYTLQFAAAQPLDYAFRFGLTAGGCGFVLPAEQQQFTSTGGTGSLVLQASGNCDWTAVSLTDWITINTPTGAGSSTITFNIAPNPGEYRFATLFIAGRTVTIFQTGAGGSCAPTSVTPGQLLNNELTARDCRRVAADGIRTVDRYSFTARAGERAFVKVTAEQVIAATVLPMATLNAAQLTPTAGDWLGNASYTIPADGTYIIEVFSAYNALLPAPYTMRLQVLPPGCGIAVNPALAEFGSTGGPGSVTITAEAACQYQILNGHDWLSINGPATRTGNNTLQFNVAANQSGKARTGTIGIGGQPFTVEQAGAGGQCAAQTIASGQPVTGQISHADCPARFPLLANYRDYADRYVFNGTAGQLAQLLRPGWTPNAQFSDPQIRLYDPSGNLIASDPRDNAPLLASGKFIRLPLTGVYTIEVVTRLLYANDTDATFDYTLLLTLLPSTCNYTVTLGNLSFGAAGGTGALTVATAADCTWHAAVDAPWVTLTAGNAIHTGSGQAVFTVAANPSVELRRATFILAGQSFTIEQGGSNSLCEIQPLSAGQTLSGKFDAGDCRAPQDSTGNLLMRRFSFAGTAGAQIALTLEPENNYFSFTLRLLAPNGALLLSSSGLRMPQTNELYVLPTSGTYSVELTSYRSAAFALTLFVMPNSCGFALSATGKGFAATGGVGAITVTTQSDCPWQPRSNADWITLSGGGQGNGVLNYSVAANSTPQSRSGTLIIGNRTFLIEQAGQNGSCETRTLSLGRTISGAWDEGDCNNRTHAAATANYVDRYNFNAVAGASLSATLNTQAEAVFIELYDQSGSLLAAVRSKRFPASLGLFIIPASGTYTLHVLSSWNTTYTLTAVLNPPGAINSGSTIHLNAANFKAEALAPDSLVTMFGNDLASVTQTANTPASSLGGTTVQVRDSAGTSQPAKLLFVSPTQINYIMPGGLAYGAATITTTNSAGTEMTDTVQIAPVAPGLFAADASGRGLAAGVVLRVKANQAQVFEPLARFDAAQNRFVAVPIDVGVAGEAVYLVLFGTGYRWRSAMTAVTAQLTGLGGAGSPVSLAVSYAGQQGDLGGLDQLNIPLPSTLSGRGEGEISLSVDGKAANPLRLVVK